MKLTKTQTGEMYMWGAAFLWSFFPIFSILSFRTVPPLFTAGISMLISAVFFTVLMFKQRRWHELKVRGIWHYLIAATLMNGILVNGLIFIGTSMTTAGNASILTLSELFFSMTILRLWQKEFLSQKQVFGSIFLVAGALLVLFQDKLKINIGNIMIVVAMAIPPIANYLMTQVRNKISAISIIFARSIMGGTALFGISLAFETTPTSSEIYKALPFVLLSGILLFGLSKIFWLEAIHRIPISKGLAMSSVQPAITLIFAFFMLGEIPRPVQLIGLIPMMIGVLMLTDFSRYR
jgi:drug/metabolite transporter (DMT)-like permease